MLYKHPVGRLSQHRVGCGTDEDGGRLSQHRVGYGTDEDGGRRSQHRVGCGTDEESGRLSHQRAGSGTDEEGGRFSPECVRRHRRRGWSNLSTLSGTNEEVGRLSQHKVFGGTDEECGRKRPNCAAAYCTAWSIGAFSSAGPSTLFDCITYAYLFFISCHTTWRSKEGLINAVLNYS